MKWIRGYNESQLIKATDETIRSIVSNEVDKLGSNCDLNHIDVSEVTDMSYLFLRIYFLGDVSKWDVSRVKNMDRMFYCSYFNGDISKWNVRNVKNMEMMFWSSNFNNDITNWNVRSVQNMYAMFMRSKFNFDLSKWRTISLKYQSNMFSSSPIMGREPWWWQMSIIFKSHKLMWRSIGIFEWIDTDRKIIWKKRLNYALQEFGLEDYTPERGIIVIPYDYKMY